MRLLALALGLLLSACAGYHVGEQRPAAMREVETIAVTMFRNETLHPRAEALATSAIHDAFLLDGTYRLTRPDAADAILEGTIQDINYSPIRGSRLDTLRPQELQNAIALRWTLRDPRDPTRILARGTSQGISRFFVDANLQTSRNNALPDAFQRASEALVSRLANGF